MCTSMKESDIVDIFQGSFKISLLRVPIIIFCFILINLLLLVRGQLEFDSVVNFRIAILIRNVGRFLRSFVALTVQYELVLEIFRILLSFTITTTCGQFHTSYDSTLYGALVSCQYQVVDTSIIYHPTGSINQNVIILTVSSTSQHQTSQCFDCTLSTELPFIRPSQRTTCDLAESYLFFQNLDRCRPSRSLFFFIAISKLLNLPNLLKIVQE